VADLENELEEKKAQQELEGSKERYRIIFDGSRETLHLRDLGMKVRQVLDEGRKNEE
jgi:hypothetical protein